MDSAIHHDPLSLVDDGHSSTVIHEHLTSLLDLCRIDMKASRLWHDGGIISDRVLDPRRFRG
jgi:hypothetical protein